MKNSTKILIGVVVVALVGAGVYFGGGDLFKGSLAPKSSVKPILTPLVTKTPFATEKLNNGLNDIAAFDIKAWPTSGVVTLKKFAVKFSKSSRYMNVEALQLSRQRYGGSTVTESNITGNVSIKNKAGQDLKAGGSNLSTTDTIYVTWDKNNSDEEFIPENGNRYIIRATVSNASANEAISTQLLTDVNKPQKTNANALSKYNFVWSDQSAGDNHSTLTNDWFHGGSVPYLPLELQTFSF